MNISDVEFEKSMNRLGKICLALAAALFIGSACFAINQAWCNAVSFALVGSMGCLCWANFKYSIWYFRKHPPRG